MHGQAKFDNLQHKYTKISDLGDFMIVENFVYFMSRIFMFSNYIETARGFEKPLTLEQEQELFVKAHNGDKNARESLISHNLRLVAHIVKKYHGSLEADDLISVGTIGLIKAIDSFDYAKGVQLSTYAARCIDNEILMLIRSNKKHKNVLSLNSMYSGDDDDNELELLDIISTDEEQVIDVVENNIYSSKLIKIINEKLSKREKEIITMRYGLNGSKVMTQKEVAQKLGISRSYISRIENKAIKIIKENASKY